MPSTYTLNNGIELIATGEQSGTWGDTTNLNLGLVDTALDGQVTVTLAAAGSSGAPNALPISDGSASNGRNRLIIFADGGDLGATAFVQLTPNDAEKIVYIRNDLSGGRAITLFQGTYNASNDYEVPAGTTAIVFFNGGGAGAVAANVFNNAFFDSLRLGGVSVTAILDEDNMASDSATALATQQSIKAYVDAEVGANNELSEVLANGNTSGGTDIQMTTTDEVQFRDTALTIRSSVDGQLDIAADVELEIVAPTLDINASTAVTIDTTTMTMTGSVNVVGDLDVDNLNVNGNTIISTNTNGNIALTPNGTGEVDITKVDIDGGTIDGTVIGGSTPAAISATTGSFSGDVGIGTSSGTGRLTVADGTTSILTLRATSAIDAAGRVIGTINFQEPEGTGDGTLAIESSISALRAGSDSFNSGGLLTFSTRPFNGSLTERARIDASGNLLVGGTSNSLGSRILAENASGNQVGIRYTGVATYYLNATSDGALGINKDGTERLRITSTGSVGIGTSSPDRALTNAGNITSTRGDNPWYELVETDGTTTHNKVRLYLTGDDFIIQSRSNADDFVSNDYRIFRGASGATVHQWSIASSEAMRITSTGSVGIGTSSPDEKLVVAGDIKLTGASFVHFTNTSDTISVGAAASSILRINSNAASGRIEFQANGSERLRIDASGNLLVGKTTDNQALAGVKLGTSGSNMSRDNEVLVLNRLSTDGTILNLKKDGTTVGSIGSRAGVTSHFIGDPRAGGAGITAVGTQIRSTDQTGALVDGTIDLGGASNRWKDLYLSGGVYLGGTGSANLLDDYEEGTWTPEIEGLTHTVQNGKYTKVGNLVTAQFQINTDILVDATAARIVGLPFTASNDTAEGRSAGFLSYNETGTALTLLFQSSTTAAQFRDAASGLSANRTTLSGHVMWGTFIYRTAQ